MTPNMAKPAEQGHSLRVSHTVYVRLVRKMRARESFDDVLRRVLHLPSIPKPWLEEAMEENGQPASGE